MHGCSVDSVVFDSLQLYGLEPARLPCPWDSSGKNTGVSCHALFPGDLPDPGTRPLSHAPPALKVDYLPLNHQRGPHGM